MNIEELKAIFDLTVKLTELKLNECSHLCIENFAPELLERLITAHQSSIDGARLASTTTVFITKEELDRRTKAGQSKAVD